MTAIADPATSASPKRLFYGCFAAIFATACGFIIRALLLNEFGLILNLTEAQKGAINGAGLFPFAISIVLFSLVIDRIGYGRVMALAFLGHIVATVMTIFAITSKSYPLLYSGTFLLALANGAVEAVINPVTASLFPKNKTHYLNILHAGWPAGMVLGGAIVLLMGGLDPQWKIALVFIPTIVYGIMLFGPRFPVQERVAAGVSHRDMMREFGAAGALLLTYFLVQAVSQVLTVANLPEINQLWSLIIGVVAAAAYFAVYKSIGRPLFIFLLLIMILLATTELGIDSWVTDLMNPVFGQYAGWILIYTSLIMFALRFCAGPLLHRMSPLALLCVCSALAALGLLSLAFSTTGFLVFLAASIYGVGKAFFWPTTLGVVSEQFPKGGALTINAIAGMGMIAVGVLGSPFLGATLDHRLDQNLQQRDATVHAAVAKAEETKYGLTHRPLDQDKVAALPAAQKNIVHEVTAQTKQKTLALAALLPATMFLCYLGLILYFKSRGGYRQVTLPASSGANP
jgi:MFS family permease